MLIYYVSTSAVGPSALWGGSKPQLDIPVGIPEAERAHFHTTWWRTLGSFRTHTMRKSYRRHRSNVRQFAFHLYL
jgi:hypothetical protein